jgi:hypothetical protein
MADDITIPASGTGTATPKVATDDVGGSHYQKIKLDLGGDGASAPAVGTVPVSGTVTVGTLPTGTNTIGSVTPTARSVTGNLAAVNDTVVIDVLGAGCVVVTCDATFSGSVELEYFNVNHLPGWKEYNGAFSFDDGGNIPVAPVILDTFSQLLIPTVGMSQVRARATTISTAGDVTLTALPNPMPLGSLDDTNYALHLDNLGELTTGGYFTPDGGMFIPKSAGLVFNGGGWDKLRGDILGLHVSRSATSATATLSNVSGSASSVTLLALNAARKGASIYNDSTAILYVKFGTTASATSFTVKMAADAHYEVPFGFTGRIDGIWASATGAARITEMT